MPIEPFISGSVGVMNFNVVFRSFRVKTEISGNATDGDKGKDQQLHVHAFLFFLVGGSKHGDGIREN